MTEHTLALVEGGMLIGKEVPSLFGGAPRFSVERRPHYAVLDDDGRLVLSLHPEPTSDTAVVVDLARLSLPRQNLARGGQAGGLDAAGRAMTEPEHGMRVLAEQLVSPQSGVPETLGGSRSRQALLFGPEVMAESLINPLAKEANEAGGALFLRRSISAETSMGAALDAAALDAGLRPAALEEVMAHTPAPEGQPQEPPRPQPVIFADPRDIYLADGVGLRRICPHGQAGAIAAGLAPAITWMMVEHAGPEAVELWQSSYTAHARDIAVQQVERKLHAALLDAVDPLQADEPLHLGGRLFRVFPPLPFTAFTAQPDLALKVERYRLARESKPGLEKLITSLQQKHRDLTSAFSRLLGVCVRVTVPSLDDNRAWFEGQKALLTELRRFAGRPIRVLGVGYGSPLGRFLVESGRRLSARRPGWFRPNAGQQPRPIEMERPAPEASMVEAALESEGAPPSESNTTEPTPAPVVPAAADAKPAAAPKPDTEPPPAPEPEVPLAAPMVAPRNVPREVDPDAPVVVGEVIVGNGGGQPEPEPAPPRQPQRPAKPVEPPRPNAGLAPRAAIVDPQVVELPVLVDPASVEVYVDGELAEAAGVQVRRGLRRDALTRIELSGARVRPGANVVVTYEPAS